MKAGRVAYERSKQGEGAGGQYGAGSGAGGGLYHFAASPDPSAAQRLCRRAACRLCDRLFYCVRAGGHPLCDGHHQCRAHFYQHRARRALQPQQCRDVPPCHRLAGCAGGYQLFGLSAVTGAVRLKHQHRLFSDGAGVGGRHGAFRRLPPVTAGCYSCRR